MPFHLRIFESKKQRAGWRVIPAIFRGGRKFEIMADVKLSPGTKAELHIKEHHADQAHTAARTALQFGKWNLGFDQTPRRDKLYDEFI